MILACTACDSRYDVTGHEIGQRFRCRCGQVLTLEARTQAGRLTCPHCGAGVDPSAKRCDHCSSALLLKACPRCLSRVFHGHKHCPECGAELDVAAIAGASADRPCPRCEGVMLHARRVDDLVIDECDHCHGVFLDHIAIQRVVTDRQQARAEAVLGALPPGEVVEQPAGRKMYIKCPICSTVMNRKLFSAGSGVIIDVCRAHGAFFDPGELPRIIQFVMNGGLEQAHRKELERMREDIKREQQNAQFAAMMSARSSTTAVNRASRDTAGGALVDLLFALWR